MVPFVPVSPCSFASALCTQRPKQQKTTHSGTHSHGLKHFHDPCDQSIVFPAFDTPSTTSKNPQHANNPLTFNMHNNVEPVVLFIREDSTSLQLHSAGNEINYDPQIGLLGGIVRCNW